jgi:hypothetical protein
MSKDLWVTPYSGNLNPNGSNFTSESAGVFFFFLPVFTLQPDAKKRELLSLKGKMDASLFVLQQARNEIYDFTSVTVSLGFIFHNTYPITIINISVT